jgi:hypothetical protein
MSYEQLRSIVGGANPQSASYGDIISAIQSQYTPQTQFAPTRSLLDTLGTQLPEQPRIAYGSLLQAQPRVLPTPMTQVKVLARLPITQTYQIRLFTTTILLVEILEILQQVIWQKLEVH